MRVLWQRFAFTVNLSAMLYGLVFGLEAYLHISGPDTVDPSIGPGWSSTGLVCALLEIMILAFCSRCLSDHFQEELHMSVITRVAAIAVLGSVCTGCSTVKDIASGIADAAGAIVDELTKPAGSGTAPTPLPPSKSPAPTGSGEPVAQTPATSSGTPSASPIAPPVATPTPIATKTPVPPPLPIPLPSQSVPAGPDLSAAIAASPAVKSVGAAETAGRLTCTVGCTYQVLDRFRHEDGTQSMRVYTATSMTAADGKASKGTLILDVVADPQGNIIRSKIVEVGDPEMQQLLAAPR